jgi:TrmH family RNA methyltransferase
MLQSIQSYMLTSTKNPRIKHIRELQKNARTRRKEGVFVVEGIRQTEEALAARWRPDLVLFTQDITDRGYITVDNFRALRSEVLEVTPHVMKAASDTQTPQGILAIFPIPQWERPANPTFLLLTDGVRDPGNLGTLLRTALAAGVDGVIIPPENVDVFSPKVVRAGMGAHFRLPILSLDWKNIQNLFSGLNIFLADSASGQSYFETDFKTPLALIIGGEAAGAGKQALQLATHHIHIPMPGETESLNVASAGAILMFEVVRQRG